MADEADAWGDLFAKAAEVLPTPSDDANKNHFREDDDEPPPNKKQKKQKKQSNKSNKKRKGYYSNNRPIAQACLHQESEYEKFCTSRLSVAERDHWPAWLSISAPLVSRGDRDNCKTWKPISEAKNLSTCEICGSSAAQHTIHLSRKVATKTDNKNRVWPLLAFVHLRNLRCIARHTALCNKNELSYNLQESLEKENKHLKQLRGVMSAALGFVPEELSLLDDKFTAVFDATSALIHVLQLIETSNENSKKNRWKCFEAAIRLIMACDAAYYRLYYLQLTQLVPCSSIFTESNNTTTIFLPHPQEYFRINFLTMDIDSTYSSVKSLLKRLESGSDKGDDPLLECFVYQMRQLQPPPKAEDHPLCQIHRLRLAETISLFWTSGWYSSPTIKRDILRELSKTVNSETLHETPAPRILTEWRDSCRDFMCNLYAYATLPSNGISKITTWLANQKLQGVVEVGAGTGYVAKLLKDAGVQILASDLHPTDGKQMNSYHGFTPTFTDIVYASAISETDAGQKALFLCYPPPGSTMAFDTLKAYMKHGGQALIHIGEFKGLTGDADFESLLLTNFERKDCIHCLGWGSDASHVTFWVRSKAKPARSSLLLPCCGCNRREATKRCRLLRSLVYCSSTCFEGHRVVRENILSIYAIAVDEQLKFDNKNHFLDL
jgi:uncharacterized protein (DUF1330 family)